MKSVTLSNQEHKDLIEMLNDTDDSRVTSIINKLQLPQPTGLREAVVDAAEKAFNWSCLHPRPKLCVDCKTLMQGCIWPHFKLKLAELKAALANEGKEE